MRIRLIFQGSWRVYAICDGDGCPVVDFLDAGTANDRLAKAKKATLSYFDRIAHTIQLPRESEITHLIDGKQRIWQTTHGQVRVLWFFDEGRVIVMSHGFLKRSAKTPSGQIEHARKAKVDYLRAKEVDDLWKQENC